MNHIMPKGNILGVFVHCISPMKSVAVCFKNHTAAPLTCGLRKYDSRRAMKFHLPHHLPVCETCVHCYFHAAHAYVVYYHPEHAENSPSFKQLSEVLKLAIHSMVFKHGNTHVYTMLLFWDHENMHPPTGVVVADTPDIMRRCPTPERPAQTHQLLYMSALFCIYSS